MIFKICKKHGNLSKSDVIKSGIRDGLQQYKCRYCMKDFHTVNYNLFKDCILKRNARYRKENPERVALQKKISYKKNKHKYLKRENERKKLHERECRKNLSDRYVKKLIVKRTGLSMADIPSKLIEVVRAVQLLKKGIKIHRSNQRILLKETTRNEKK